MPSAMDKLVDRMSTLSNHEPKALDNRLVRSPSLPLVGVYDESEDHEAVHMDVAEVSDENMSDFGGITL